MEKIMLKVFLGFVLLFGAAVHAQDKLEVLETKDPMIEALQRLRSASSSGIDRSNLYGGGGDRSVPGTKMKVSGYRVQIYSGNNRNDAYSAQSKFKRIYPNINTYVSYSQPNYRVKAGDFTSKAQAQGLMEELKKNFNSVFIFNEEVTIEY